MEVYFENLMDTLDSLIHVLSLNLVATNKEHF